MPTKLQQLPHIQNIIATLMAAVVFLLPFGRLSELPIIVLALMGLFSLLIQWPNVIQQKWFKPFSYVFLAYFLMTAISAIDSYWVEKSWLISLAS